MPDGCSLDIDFVFPGLVLPKSKCGIHNYYTRLKHKNLFAQEFIYVCIPNSASMTELPHLNFFFAIIVFCKIFDKKITKN